MNLKNIQKLKIKWLLFAFLCLCLVVLISISAFTYFRFSDHKDPYLSENQQNVPSSDINRSPSNIYISPFHSNIIPAGTQMYIPPWVLQQYELIAQQDLYEDSLSFLIHHYSVAAPSTEDGEEDTYYIPLTYYSGSDSDYDYDDDDDYYNDGSGYSRTAMVDVTHVSATQRNRRDSENSATPKIKATKNIDTIRSPSVPPPKPVTSPLGAPSCDVADTKTEASAGCVDCISGENSRQMQGGLQNLITTVNRFRGSKNFNSLVETFCNNCYGVDVVDFFGYIERRASSENVPPEILFAIMLRESNGVCSVEGDGGKSVGLFQLNTGNSTHLNSCPGKIEQMKVTQMKKVCENGKYGPGQPSSTPGVCLDNPYCNFEEALHLLKGEKWSIGNKGRKQQRPAGKNWVQMSAEERNLWRNAIISYNGAAYLKPAERAMRTAGKKDKLDDWEWKRLYFIKDYLTRNKSKGLLHNLAYVERITGREAQGGFANSSICQWIRFRQKNNTLSCQ